MNPSAFSELLTDISDEYIVSAANPHSKPIRWYQISAIAAGIVLLIAAAVYPKLRMQMPEVTEPPVMTAVTTAAVTTESEQTTGTLTEFAKVQTTEARTSLTRIQTTATITVYTTAVTVPPQTAPTAHTEITKAATTFLSTGYAELSTCTIPASATTAQITNAILTYSPIEQTTADTGTQSELHTVLTTSADDTSNETELIDPLERVQTLFEAFIANNHLPAKIADEASYPELTGKIIIEWDPTTSIDVERAILKFAKENNIDGYLFVMVKTVS